MRHSETRSMSRTMAALAWLVIIGMLLAFFSNWLSHQGNPNQRINSTVDTEGRVSVQLKRNRLGHYVASGSVNSVPVTFLLDTGATGVAIPASLAHRAGVDQGQPILTKTANGTARAYLTTLESVRLGDIEQRNVRATIAPGLDDGQVLLGMSFLKHLELVQKGDTLTLRQ